MVKEKPNRTYDEDGFRRRAACLCVRDPDESEILLVTSSRATEYWIVPGGGVEPNEDPSEAAIRETEEEAGVKGALKRCLGDFEVRGENMERKHRTSVFVLEVKEELDEWEDSKCRKRRWFSVEEALRLLAIYKPVQCTYVKILIQTSPSLCNMAPHLASNSDQLPRSPIDSSSSNSSLPSLRTSFDSSATTTTTTAPATTSMHLMQVNHYPSDTHSASAADHRSFICLRNVYSTDSETTEDGNPPPPGNHFSDSNKKPSCSGNNNTATAECNASTAEILNSSVKS